MQNIKQQRAGGDVDAALHEMADGLYKAGIMDRTTMREFDQACLAPVRLLTSREIKALRLREKASQAVFATYLNVRADTVAAWEQSKTKPDGTALKLLSLVEQHGLSYIA